MATMIPKKRDISGIASFLSFKAQIKGVSDIFSGNRRLIVADPFNYKDVGPIRPEDLAKDIKNLRRVADALPTRRLKAYILLTKLAPFTVEETALAKTLNGRYQERVIMLTADELEPYHFKESFEKKGVAGYGSRLEELASITSKLYFTPPATPPPASPMALS